MDKESPEALKELKDNLDNNINYNPIRSPIKRFNYFMKDKAGKELSFKEFMARWKEGIEGITQLQQLKGQLNSTYLILFGISAGFIITLFTLDTLWWLSVILGAAFFNTGIQALGLWQKKKVFERLESSVEGSVSLDNMFKEVKDE